MKCETCKHWDRESKYLYNYNNTKAHHCSAVNMLNDYDDPKYGPIVVEREYTRDDNGRITDMKETMIAKAYVMDGSSYHAELVTRFDFGCVLWEENK